MNILITGSQGFIGTYLCNEFLSADYEVIGVDNFSKYGEVTRPHDSHPKFTLIKGDILDNTVLSNLMEYDFDFILAGAAMIGGISYFHKYAYDLLATNERILASTFDLAIQQRQKQLKRIVVMSSSMVFERTNRYPTPEDDVEKCPPPLSSYGFQKLASEYFCRAAHAQYGLPYTIIRPFNCVGVGENESKNADMMSVGSIKMMMSHVLPDIIQRAFILGPDKPLPILGSGNQIRNYTNGKDIGRAVRIALESPVAENQDFNISSPTSHSVKDLARVVYRTMYGKDDIEFDHFDPFQYDVQCRIPDVSKAKNLLGVSCDTTLEQSVKEVVEWMKCLRK